MQIKTKEAGRRADAIAARTEAEAEPAPQPQGKHARPARPRPPRYQMAGASPLYEKGCAELAADTLCDETPETPQIPVHAVAQEEAPAPGGEDRAQHLAMVNGQGYFLLRRSVPKPASPLPPVRPGSRLACERRCGGAGCDPANSHGCGGVFCLGMPERL
jgi:hypothetical protein